jgi:hypothetical protein
MRGQGLLCMEGEDINNALIGYYQNLFTSAVPGRLENCISSLEGRVTGYMNNQLLKAFTKEEI